MTEMSTEPVSGPTGLFCIGVTGLVLPPQPPQSCNTLLWGGGAHSTMVESM